VACEGILRERIGADPFGSQAPFRCDNCGPRFLRDGTYEGGHGELVQLDGLNLRLDHGRCACPEH